MLNSVILIGRLVREVELRYTPNGVAVANFTLAVDRPRYKDKEKEADFIPCTVWQKQAENCANYIGKGSLVAVDGRMQVRTYDDKEGNKRWVTEVIANSVQFLDKRGQKTEQGQGQAELIGQEVEFKAEDIPF